LGARNPIIHSSDQPEHIAEEKYFIYLNVRWEFFLNLLSQKKSVSFIILHKVKHVLYMYCPENLSLWWGAMLHVDSSYIWIRTVFVMCASQNLLGFSVAVM
jgi:hypothetical protein